MGNEFSQDKDKQNNSKINEDLENKSKEINERAKAFFENNHKNATSSNDFEGIQKNIVSRFLKNLKNSEYSNPLDLLNTISENKQQAKAKRKVGAEKFKQEKQEISDCIDAFSNSNDNYQFKIGEATSRLQVIIHLINSDKVYQNNPFKNEKEKYIKENNPNAAYLILAANFFKHTAEKREELKKGYEALFDFVHFDQSIIDIQIEGQKLLNSFNQPSNNFKN